MTRPASRGVSCCLARCLAGLSSWTATRVACSGRRAACARAGRRAAACSLLGFAWRAASTGDVASRFGEHWRADSASGVLRTKAVLWPTPLCSMRDSGTRRLYSPDRCLPCAMCHVPSTIRGFLSVCPPRQPCSNPPRLPGGHRGYSVASAPRTFASSLSWLLAGRLARSVKIPSPPLPPPHEHQAQHQASRRTKQNTKHGRARSVMTTAGHAEVEAFLASLGLEQHAHSLIYNGFYTSLDALRAADYHELLECNVRPVHARLIVSNLKGTPRRASSSSSGEAEVVSFLRSIGLENCTQQVLDAGFASLDMLGQTSMNSLLDAGVKPVHARLIVSNLDSASSAGLSVAPPPRNDEDEALAPLVPVSLGDPAADERRRNPLKCLLIVTGLIMLAFVPFLINQAHKQQVPSAQVEAHGEEHIVFAHGGAAPALHRRPKGGRRGKNAGGKHPKGDSARR